MNSGRRLCEITDSATEPRRALDQPDRPWLPTQITSAAIRSARRPGKIVAATALQATLFRPFSPSRTQEASIRSDLRKTNPNTSASRRGG